MTQCLFWNWYLLNKFNTIIFENTFRRVFWHFCRDSETIGKMYIKGISLLERYQLKAVNWCHVVLHLKYSNGSRSAPRGPSLIKTFIEMLWTPSTSMQKHLWLMVSQCNTKLHLRSCRVPWSVLTNGWSPSFASNIERMWVNQLTLLSQIIEVFWRFQG